FAASDTLEVGTWSFSGAWTLVIGAFSNSALLFCGAQLHPKFAALAGVRLQADMPVHALDTAANQSQADASAGKGFSGMEPLEQPKNALVKLGRDANALIGHPKAN